MLASARRLIQYVNPDRSDRPDIPAHFLYLINALEIDMVYAQGTNAARLARAHMVGTYFYTTDTDSHYYDDGVAWHKVNPLASELHLIGLVGARPAANTVPVGTYYTSTDTGATHRSDGAATWAPVVPMGWELIADIPPLGVAAASLDFSAIPATYKHLRLVTSTRSVHVAIGDNQHLRMNADGGANYQWAKTESSGTTTNLAEGVNDVGIFTGKGVGGSAPASAFTATEITIPDYTVAKFKTIASVSGWIEALTTGQTKCGQSSGTWRNVAVINQLTLFIVGGYNFDVGSRASLYGMR